MPHRQWQSSLPAAEQVAIPAVPVSVGMLDYILIPENLKRHMFALQLPGHHRPVRLCLLTTAWLRRNKPIQPPFQLRVADLGRYRQERPARANRFSVSRTVVGPIPTRSPATRVESPASRLRRKISRTWRISTLLVGIHVLRLFNNQGTVPNDQASHHPKLRAFKSECRAASNRNAARDQIGIPRAMISESALVFGGVVAEVIKRLQDQHLEHHDLIYRLAPGLAFACLGIGAPLRSFQCHPQPGAKIFPGVSIDVEY